mgnify:CR=1 FL=1
MLEYEIWGNTVQTWVVSILIVIGAFVVVKLLSLLGRKVIKPFIARTNNRVDDIIVFHKLTKEDTSQIAGKMLDTLRKKLCDMEIGMEFTPEAVAAVAEQGYDPLYGARPLRRVIQNQIEDAVSERMLEGVIAANKGYRCTYDEGKFVFTEV